jgi:hypothetical protein
LNAFLRLIAEHFRDLPNFGGGDINTAVGRSWAEMETPPEGGRELSHAQKAARSTTELDGQEGRRLLPLMVAASPCSGLFLSKVVP